MASAGVRSKEALVPGPQYHSINGCSGGAGFGSTNLRAGSFFQVATLMLDELHFHLPSWRLSKSFCHKAV